MIEEDKVHEGMIFNFCSYFNDERNTASLVPLKIGRKKTDGTMEAVNMDSGQYLGTVYDTKYLHKINTPIHKVIEALKNGREG